MYITEKSLNHRDSKLEEIKVNLMTSVHLINCIEFKPQISASKQKQKDSKST